MSIATIPDTYDSDSGTNSSILYDDHVDNPSGGVGLSDAQVGRKRRYALDLINRLQNTGVQTDIDLPQIAVIGNQSAGKSSLIEAISGITLPRASGTCTRCPTECRLAYTPAPAPWKCVISIRSITDSSGQPLGQAKNEPFGNVIYNKNEVEERIRRAQRAILNPHISRSQMLTSDEEPDDATTLTFSSNCVSLQISGPDVADLSFCDLPGLIRSTSGKEGSTDDIKLVESLVESYIKRPSCIILLTVSCETDPQNQGALQLAREHDPDGLRTVGVLTKPDRISAGDEGDWVPFVKNEGNYKLLNNWYCVKQPNSNELKAGITWQEARNKENQFFNATAPWRDLDSIYQRYLRTQNLVERLSAILSELIYKRLPEIYKELQQQMQKTREELAKLPKEPSRDPLSDITAMIHDFTIHLSKVLEGTPDPNALLQSIRPVQETFRRDIRNTAPNFRPYEKQHASYRPMPSFKFLQAEEEEEKDDDNEGHAHNAPIYIDEVFRQIQDARTRELPGKSPYIVEEWFIQQITKKWAAPSQRLCEKIYQITLEHLLRLVEEHFVNFGQGILERHAKLIVTEHMKERFEYTKDRIEWLLDLENRPFTMNTHYLADYKEKFFSYYKGFRDQDVNQELRYVLEGQKQRTGLDAGNGNAVTDVLTSLTRLGFTGLKATDLMKLMPADEMEPALEIMAEIRAYYQVAYKRYVDNIPAAIDFEMIRGFERDFLRILTSRLGIHGEDGVNICKELAQESPHVAARREELVKKLERMKAGSDELSRIS